MLLLTSNEPFYLYSKKGTEATEAQNGQNTGKIGKLDLKLYHHFTVHIHRKGQTCRLARSQTHAYRYSQTISESAKIQTEEAELLYLQSWPVC